MNTIKTATIKERQHAVSRVWQAVKAGRLIRPDICGRCGVVPKRIVAHHEDYDKLLDVIWLCDVCHKKIHGPPNWNKDRTTFHGKRLPMLEKNPAVSCGLLREPGIIDEHKYHDISVDWEYYFQYLSRRQKTMISMRYGFMGRVYTLGEIGRRYGITQQAVIVAIRNATRKLRKVFDGKPVIKPFNAG